MNETEFKAKHIVNMHGFYFLQNDASFSIFERPSDRFSWMLCSHGCSWTPDVEGYEEETKCSLYVVRYVKNNIYSKTTLSFFFYFQEQSGHQISSFKQSSEETYTREYCLDLLPNSHN